MEVACIAVLAAVPVPRPGACPVSNPEPPARQKLLNPPLTPKICTLERFLYANISSRTRGVREKCYFSQKFTPSGRKSRPKLSLGGGQWGCGSAGERANEARPGCRGICPPLVEDNSCEQHFSSPL